MSGNIAEISESPIGSIKSRHSDAGDPVLSWLIFTGLTVVAFMLLWFYGLAQKALTADPTHITSVIVLIYIAASLHCLWRAIAISREAAAAKHLAQTISSLNARPTLAHHDRLSAVTSQASSSGVVADHVDNLVKKSELTGAGSRLDQTILLRVLAERLSGSNSIGAFTSDLTMKIGLFGTIIGFIMMLAPIAGLNTDDQAAIKSSMSLMSEGMAVAMYTTLAGLVASILIKLEYQFVETATSRIFTSAVALTEVYVIPVLQRRRDTGQ